MASQPESEQAGRRAAILEQALTEARAALRNQARRHAPGEAEAEDALQEASIDFLRFYDGPSGVDAVRWLNVAIKHRAWEQGRKQRLARQRTMIESEDGPEIQIPANTPDPAERVARGEQVERFIAAMMQLKPDERTALIMFGLGYSYRDICERRGWTYTKVNRCLAEGRAALRKLVD
ncbi:MAG: RNA polymerase sigma factor [Solirubrobacterales bacterium]